MFGQCVRDHADRLDPIRKWMRPANRFSRIARIANLWCQSCGTPALLRISLQFIKRLLARIDVKSVPFGQKPVMPKGLHGDTQGGQLELSPLLLSQFNLNRSIHQRGTEWIVPHALSPFR